MPAYKPWKLISRKKVYDSKFLKVYEDAVELPNGNIIDDYTVVEKPSIVMVVATTSDDKVVVLQEYKYAAGKQLLTLPAGHIKASEKPVDAAKRELLEETGFTAKSFEEVGILHDYPTKDLHLVHVVRARNITAAGNEKHEETESITWHLLQSKDIKRQITSGQWQASSAVAALTCSGVLF